MFERVFKMGATLPNLVSLGRLCASPVTVWLVLIGEFQWAFWLFVLSGVSDAADGILARVLKARSVLGTYLDPIADKAMLVGAFFALGYAGVMPVWIVVLVVSRDVFIIGGAVLVHALAAGDGPIRPSVISKINTFLQIVLAGIGLAVGAFELEAYGLVPPLAWAVAATSVVSGLGYLVEAGRRIGLEEVS